MVSARARVGEAATVGEAAAVGDAMRAAPRAPGRGDGDAAGGGARRGDER